MHLVDIGANLTHDSFDRDRDAVLTRAREAGVVQMVVTGASREHSPLALQLAQRHPGFLYATAGVHPHHATEYTDECDAEMRALHAHPEMVAVGECGLDYFRDFSPRPAQRKAFERQLQIGVDTAKPLFLHQRDAHEDFMAMMKDVDGRLGPAVVHCFTGTRGEMFDYLDNDWYIGITGWLCDERRGQHLRELVKHIPADRLLHTLGTGLYVSDLWYLNYSDRQACRMTGMTRFACFWVEDGELVAPLDVMRFDDSFLRMFGEGLVGLTDRAETLPEAGTYQSRQLSSITTPAAIVDDWRLTL